MVEICHDSGIDPECRRFLVLIVPKLCPHLMFCSKIHFIHPLLRQLLSLCPLTQAMVDSSAFRTESKYTEAMASHNYFFPESQSVILRKGIKVGPSLHPAVISSLRHLHLGCGGSAYVD